MATSDADARLERTNRVREGLGVRPLTAQQVEHDRALADPSELRLAVLIDACATIGHDGASPA